MLELHLLSDSCHDYFIMGQEGVAMSRKCTGMAHFVALLRCLLLQPALFCIRCYPLCRSAQQRYFKLLCVSLKTPTVV
jgi:hypothetical protein